MKGNVHIETSEALKIKANDITYAKSTETADIDETVEFEVENIRGKSFGATVKMGEKRLDLLNDVEIETFESADLARSNIRFAKLNSGSATFDQIGNKIDLKTTVAINIIARDKTTDIQADRASVALAGGDVKARQALTTQAEAKTAAAETALAKLAATRKDERGTIITLSGGLLFRSNEAILMPGAAEQLDQVAAALAATSDRNVVVEGYTDSEGSTAYNLALSQRRADAVRNYLVHKGYPAARLEAHGIGEGSPIADNSTNAGRANNRRVEIVLERVPMP